MRAPATAARVEALLRALGRRARGPGRLYLVGGATAVLYGWRETTLDVDMKLDPEPPGVFDAIRALKDELDINIELASPDQFIPPLPGWEERSTPVGAYGPVEVLHYDLRAQALSKIERGLEKDLGDVSAMLDRGMVTGEELRRAFELIRPDLVRYPRLDEEVFEAKLREALGG